eukprot:g44220.t1
MLEKACMAVEEAAKGGGVYPEVLFEVAHQWYWLYEQTAGGSQQREMSARGAHEAGRASAEHPPLAEGSATVTVAATVTATAVVPVITVGSTMYQQHTIAGTAIAHPHGQVFPTSPVMSHPYTTIQTHIPSVCNAAYLGHPIQHVPRPAIFPVAGAAYPQYPYTVATTTHPAMAAPPVTFAGVPVPPMAPMAVHPYQSDPNLPLASTVAGRSRVKSSLSQRIMGLLSLERDDWWWFNLRVTMPQARREVEK